MDRGALVRSLKACQGASRQDALIEIAYSERRRLLTEDDYWDLGFPESEIETRLTDAASTNEPFRWPDDFAPAARAGWRCTIHGKLFLGADYPPEVAIEILDDTVLPVRRAEILAGNPLSEGEWLTLEEIVEGGFTDVFLFRCENPEGQGLTYVVRVGEWGETEDTLGPFLDDENPLQAIAGKDDLLIPSDELWLAQTPEWRGTN